MRRIEDGVFELRNYADGFVRRLRPPTPVAWFASLMGNCDDEHNVRQHFVHHSIGEAANQQPSKSAIAWHSCTLGNEAHH